METLEFPLCLHLALSTDHGTSDGTYPGGDCASTSTVEFTATTNARESVGSVVYTYELDPLGEASSLQGTLRSLLPVQPASAQGVAFRVEVGWHLRYAMECRDIAADFTLLVQGRGINGDEPPGDVTSALCQLLTTEPPSGTAGIDAVRGYAQIAQSLGEAALQTDPGLGASPLPTLLDGLRATFGPFGEASAAASATPAPVAPGAGAEGLRGEDSGSLLAAADPESRVALIQESWHDANPAGSASLESEVVAHVPNEAAPRSLAQATPIKLQVGEGTDAKPEALTIDRPRFPAALRMPAREAGAASPASEGSMIEPAGLGTTFASAPELMAPPVAVAIAAGLAAAVGWLVLALYHRLGPPRALKHPARRALYAACLERSEGATAGELAAAAGVDRKTAEYHLVYIARLGLVRERRFHDAPRRFLPPGPPQAASEDNSSLAERLLGAIRDRPGLTTAQLARMFSITESRAERRVKDLLLAGRLEGRVESGTRSLFAISPERKVLDIPASGNA